MKTYEKTKYFKHIKKIMVLYYTDWIRYYYQKFNNRKINKVFRKDNPSFKLPPDYLIYESFRINYPKYFESGKQGALSLIRRFEKHIDLKDKKKLDWGCGPGRIIRHFPDILGNKCSYYGTDYNAKIIEWNKKNIKNVVFNNNSLEAKIIYEDNFFDVI